MPFVIGTLLVIGVVVLYVVSFSLNEKTKAPEGCDLPDDFSGCGSCSSNGSCHAPRKKIETKIDIHEIK